MKKLIALLLILSLIGGMLLCFASCDGKKDPNADGGNGTVQGDNNEDNTGNAGNNDGENTVPDLTDDTYPEDVANDIF